MRRYGERPVAPEFPSEGLRHFTRKVLFAVTEFKLSCHNKETLSFTDLIYRWLSKLWSLFGPHNFDNPPYTHNTFTWIEFLHSSAGYEYLIEVGISMDGDYLVQLHTVV